MGRAPFFLNRAQLDWAPTALLFRDSRKIGGFLSETSSLRNPYRNAPENLEPSVINPYVAGQKCLLSPGEFAVTAPFLSVALASRPLDVCSVENALIDLLVRAESSDLAELGMQKGVMQLVEASAQVRALGNLGKLTAEVELGGSAANAIRVMAQLGSKTSYSSCVAHDRYGQSFSARLEELGILNRLAVVPGDTGTCLVVVTPDGERTLNTHLGACRSYQRGFLPEEDISRSKLFFTTGYVWDTPSQIEAIEHALVLAAEAKVKVALDLADPFVVARSGVRMRELLKHSVALCFANADEAHGLVGCRGEKAALILAETVEVACVKDGANGAYVASHGKAIHIAPEKVNVVDTTGAGDLFAGGFMYGLCKGYRLETCGKIASLLAADTIMHMGVRSSPKIFARVRQLEAADARG